MMSILWTFEGVVLCPDPHMGLCEKDGCPSPHAHAGVWVLDLAQLPRGRATTCA